MAVPSKPSAALSIYRRLLCGAALLSLLGMAAGAAAQATPSKNKRKEGSARAVAVLEWKKDGKGVLTPRLVPISLLWEGKYYDAGVYEASPLPLALDTGTVYEALRSGVPAGLFRLEGGIEIRNVWYGVGQWSPGARIVPAKESSGDSGRPRLKRAAGASDAPAAPAASSGAATTKSVPAPPPEDPDRPRLQRGMPASAAEAPLPPPPAATAKAGASDTGAKPEPAKSVAQPEPLVAVSDPEPYENRPYPFPWNRDEEERRTTEVKALAEAAVAREAGEKVTLEQVQARAFDLYLDNSPEIVLSARTAPGKHAPKGLLGQPRTYYVTVVARVTASGEVRKLFSSVTSSSWLGSVPRLEVVDAVDADGDGKGDLLFKQITETSHSYILYRIGRDELFPLVGTGPLPND